MSHDDEPPQNELPSFKDLIDYLQSADNSEDALSDYEKQFQQSFDNTEWESQRKWIHLQGLADHYSLKKGWSGTLKWLLIFMVGFQWILLACVGWGWWDFTKYQWLLPVLLVQNLGQIIGLAFVVVKSLFKDLKT